MNKKDRAKIISQILNQYFPDPPVPLFYKNTYTLLIAVLLSAQSTDKSVNKVTPKLFKLADSPQKMVSLSQKEIQEIIRPCGLSNKKSHAILALSKELIKKYKGNVPKNLKALESLPGVGHKTASVIMSLAFHHPAFPIDTHIFRCAKRWKLSNAKTKEKVEKDLKKLFPKAQWHKLHLQIIHFARKFCPAKGHKIERCPICSILKNGPKTGRKAP